MDKKTKIIGVAATAGVVAIGCGGSFYFSPYLALNHMKTAIVNRDADALAGEIDFPALRTSIKAGVRSQILKQIATSGANLTPEMSQKMIEKIDPEVDKKVTPEGLDELMQDKLSGSKLDVANLEKNIADSEIESKYESLDRFVVLITDKVDRSKAVSLILKRTGFSWKLSGVNISKV